MPNIRLVESRSSETVDALRYLLEQAQRGGLSVSVTFWRPGENEEAIFTGAYKARPELALMAALRLSKAILRASGEIDRGP